MEEEREKEIPLQKEKMKNKIALMFAFSLILLVLTMAFVSSADWDNKLTYSDNDLKVTLKNSILGLIPSSEIGTAELKSHKTVEEILTFGYGKEDVVMYYDFDFIEEYKEGLGKVYFTNERTGKVIEKDYTFVYAVEKERDVFESVCDNVITLNGTVTCNTITKKETYTAWLPYNSKDIPQENIRIGLKTYIDREDYIDAVWTIGGKKVKKHGSWTGSLDTDLEFRYAFNETSGALKDYSTNGWDITIPSITYEGGVGMVDEGYNFTGGANENQTIDYASARSIAGAGSYSVWYKPSVVNEIDFILSKSWGSSGRQQYAVSIQALSKYGCASTAGETQAFATSTTTAVIGQWAHITCMINATGISIWINGTIEDYGAQTGLAAIGATANNFTIGNRGKPSSSVYWIGGEIDELYFWSRALSASEIDDVFLDGGSSFPSSTLNAPADTITVYNPNIMFNATGTDNDTVQNMSLIVNGSYISTNSTPYNNTLTQFSYTLPSASYYNWTIEVCDNLAQCTNATYRGITYSNTISITLNAPVNAFNSTSQNIIFNGTGSDDTTVQNISFILNATYNGTNSTPYNNILTQFDRNLLDGFYNWTMEACDNLDTCVNATARNITIDSTLPEINFSAPTNGQNFPYLISLNNITLNTTITDTNLDTCWYQYNNTNTTFSCTSGVLSTNNLTLTNASAVTVWANDTPFANLDSSTSDWTYDVFDFNNYTYDTNITEFTSTTFIGNFQTGTSISSAYLLYNNTNNSVSISSLGGNRYTLSSTITTPVISTDTNITWFFWINNVNTTQFNQTVLNVVLDNCNSYTNYIINYTLVDELTQENIVNVNSTIDSLVYLKTLGGRVVTQFNRTFNGTATASVCSETNLNQSGLRLWEQSRYGSTNYVYEQHNLQNASMTSLPNQITLRDLPSDSATTFRVTYKSSTFLPIQDAVIDFQRKYIGEGIFKSIESPITDANGEVSLSLDLNAVIYRVVVSENGITLATFENPAIACDNILTGDCSINLNERATVNLITTYDTLNDFDYGLTQDNRTITLTFEIPSGTSKTVNLFVNQSTILGNTTSCNQTLLATNGQLQCDIALGLGDVFATAKVSADETLITTASATILDDRSQYFGTDNIVLTFFLVLSLVLLMVSSPITVLMGLLIGLIASSLMLFLNAGSIFGTTSVLLYLVIIIIILIIKISGREK